VERELAALRARVEEEKKKKKEEKK